MQSRSLQLLEFDKVLELLAGYCVSTPGAQRCRSIVPLGDQQALDFEIERLRQWLDWATEHNFVVRAFPGLDGFLQEALRPQVIFDLDDLFAVAQVLGYAKEVREVLIEGESRWPEVARMAQGDWPETLWPALKRCLNADGNLRDEASPELFQVRTEIRAVHQRCTRKVKTFVEKEGLTHYLQEEFMTVSGDRYVLPLRSNFKNRFPGIIHDYSQTGETCYFEPLFLVEINNDLQELKNEERHAEKEVLRYLSELLRRDEPGLRSAYDFLVELDVLGAKNTFAVRHNARPVEVGPDTPLDLKNARHPLLGGTNAVPVDLELQAGQRALIVSGGNAGGKTVCLKALGLSGLMALSALPVCADEGSTVPAWKSFFVLLGDEQSIEDSLSTFTAQIRHLSDAWQTIDGASLVIMDEFGAGTDPTQGAALAQAVVDGLLERNAWLGVATHFPALKAYALTRDQVRAASVLFDPNTKRPLYRLAYDQVGASQALEVAREHGLPADVVTKAEQYMLLDGSDTSAVLDRLNTLAVQREKELDQAKAELEKLREKRVRYQERFNREKDELIREVQSQAQGILKQWREDKIGRKKALKDLSDMRRKLVEKTDEEPQASSDVIAFENISEGDRFRHAGLGKDGVVTGLDERKRQLKLDMGGVSVWVAATDLIAAQASGQPRKTSSAPVVGGFGGLSLDLRGRRAEEIEHEVARFLDGAVLSGREEVEIVHGKGTGAVRQEVHRILRDFPAVKGFTLAPADRGGDGMTIVELK